MCMKYPMISAALTIDRHIRIDSMRLGSMFLIAEVNFDCRQNQKHSPHPEKWSDTVVPLLFGYALFNCLLKSVFHNFIFPGS